MNRNVYTYIDLRELENAYFWDEVKQYPQITASADMGRSLAKRKDLNVCDFRKLADRIFPRWTEDETKFHETVTLSSFFREKMVGSKDDEITRRWLIGCRRNLWMILSAILLLEEADVEMESIEPAGDKNIELLIEAWEYLRENNPTIDEFHGIIDSLHTRENWNPILHDIFGRNNIDTIVFHGFYYFTPLQERIMRLMESVGIKLLFLFSFNDKYPYGNEIWLKTYSEEMGYPPIDRWNSVKSEEKECYGEIFEGRKSQISNNLKIKEYGSITEFVNDIKSEKERGYNIYSSNSNVANSILRDFYPEKYGERKLLSYPIGQFVSTLNSMWDEDTQDIVVTEEKIMECFSSGWLSYKGKSGKSYLQELSNIMPFFADCSSVDEWEHRIVFLRQIEREIIEPFNRDLSRDDNVSRWQEIMGNPFLNFGVFSVPKNKLDDILYLIENLLMMAKELFKETETIYIQDHIRKLDRILKKSELSNELYKEERELIRTLFEKLNRPSTFTAACSPSDISKALSLYMSEKLNEGEIQNNKLGMVAPIYLIESASMKFGEKVHICLCDVDNMPGGRKEYIWPLTNGHIKACYEKTNNPLLINMMHIMESAYICNRYFFYVGLKTKNVHLSWIRDMGDKIQGPSPYIKLLKEGTGIEIKPPRRKFITYKHVEEVEYPLPQVAPYDLKKMPRSTPKEAKMDYAICPIKYTLGYVVDNHPTFQRAFHQTYAINGLVAAISSLMKENMDAEEIYQNVIALFPALRDVEKRQIYDYLRFDSAFADYGTVGVSELKKKEYTEERLKVEFPNVDVRDQAVEMYNNLHTPYGRSGMNLFETAADIETPAYKKRHKDVCLYCQHQDYCKYAVFAADQEAIYD